MKRLFIGGLGLFIICFLIGSIAWFGFEKQNEKLNTVNKVLNTNDIKNLDVLTENCKVLIKSSGQTSIKYKGKRNIDIKEVDNTLKVKETKELENHYGLNFNPFRQFDDHLIITLPKEKLNKLKLSSSYNSINIKNLNIKSAEISKNNKNGGKVNIDKTKFEKLLYKGVNSQIKLDDSEVINADIKTENARILSENSLIQKSVLLANHSNIYLSDIDVNSNFKASTKKGDINISYKQAPNNILLKLYPVHGTTNINNSRFVNDRVGNGDNILELYTNDGDINID